MCACVRVRVCEKERERFQEHVHMNVYVCVYRVLLFFLCVPVCMYVCMCVCKRERKNNAETANRKIAFCCQFAIIMGWFHSEL